MGTSGASLLLTLIQGMLLPFQSNVHTGTSIAALEKNLDHIFRDSMVLYSSQGTPFTAQTTQQWVHFHENNRLFMCPVFHRLIEPSDDRAVNSNSN